MNSLKFRTSPLLVCASAVALFAAGVVQAAALHVSAASASTNMLYDLTFTPAPPSTATALPATPVPAKGGSSVRSLAYVYNEQTRNLDLLAADTTGGKIVRYAAAAGAALPVWAWPVAGPRGTDGLSVDAQGNLYALSSDAARNELWVLRRDPARPPGAGFLAPLLVDNDNTHFVATSKTRLLETVVVNNPILDGPGAGDLLVLINDGRVLRYSAANLRNFLTNTAGGRPIAMPQTLVTAAQYPVGQQPTGMALWPADGSLLVATTGGAVLRFKLTTTGSTALTPFATSLGGSLGKIKAFVNSNAPYAVVGKPAANIIFALSGPSVTPAQITGVSNPIGLATPDASTATQDCVFDNSNPDKGCTLLGGGIKLGVSSANPGATIVDTTCTIDPDLRVDPQTGICNGQTLAVETLCPGFGPTVIPGYLCGASGVSRRGFSLIKSLEQNGFNVAPTDLLVKQELSADALLGGPGNPACPQLTAGWAPLTGEGTIPEGNDMIELASYCGSTRILSPGHSLIGVGLQLNTDFFGGADPTAKLVTFANLKFGYLNTTIASANMTGTVTDANTPKGALVSCVNKAQTYLNNGNGNLPVAATRYACAAHQAWTCDSTVNAANFGPNADKLSSYSAIRGRLANLVTHINSRIAGQPAPTVWPLPDPALTNPLPTGGCDPDTTPPTAPANFAASTTTQTTITLNWQPSTDSGTGIGGYIVTRTGPTASAPVTLPGDCNPCSYTDNNLNVETTYSYQLVAYDKSTLGPNNGPNLTNPVSTSASTQPDLAAPNTPTVTLGTVTTTSVALSWTASTDPTPGTGIGGYYVYRNGGANPIATVTGTSFTDGAVTPLTPATQYSYQVAAFDKSTSNNNGPNVSPLSAAVPATTLTPPDTDKPTTPTGLHYSYTGPTTLTLFWTASTDPGAYATGIGGYNVYLAGVLQGSTIGTSFPITLVTTTSAAQFLLEVEAFDKAPTPNLSTRASVTVTCYDPDTDHDCDALNHHD